jgi:spermidine/putrescine transport system substrate-binding protein
MTEVDKRERGEMSVEMDSFERVLSRRDALRRAGLVTVTLGVAPGLLAACGDSDSGGASGSEVGGSVSMLTWEGYDLKGSKGMAAWEKQNGVTVKPQFIANHDEIQAKLKSGRAGVDLITYYNSYAQLYHQLDILEEIDEAQVPNVRQCYPFFRSGSTYDQFWGMEGKRWAVPFTWGSAPCNYRADKVAKPSSWMDVFKPEYKGKVGMPDDVANFILAGRLVGHEPPNYTSAQFKEVADFMRRVRSQTAGIAAGYGDLANQLASGEVHITFSGWAAMNVWAQEKGADVQSVLPKEGSFSFVDAYALPKDAPNAASALGFMNESLSPKVQAEQAALLSAGTVNPKAVPLMDKATAGLYPYARIEELFENAPLYLYPPLDADGKDVVTYEGWTEEWAKIKAGE